MEKYAFKMHLNDGQLQEYQRRHDEIWPELVSLLKEAGISDYSIFLDEDTGTLFGVLWRTADHTMDELPLHPIMKKWWAYMGDIMQTNADSSPVAVPLTPVFHME
jgi:L-rhamnose mutarotase